MVDPPELEFEVDGGVEEVESPDPPPHPLKTVIDIESAKVVNFFICVTLGFKLLNY